MAKKKILVVDDDQGILSMLKLLLRLEGYEAVVCSEARNVLDKMASENPDLVLLDARMPHMDGLEVLNLIQAQELQRKPPIILFTGNFDPVYITQALQAGASSVLIKPFIKEELLEKLQALLEKHP